MPDGVGMTIIYRETSVVADAVLRDICGLALALEERPLTLLDRYLENCRMGLAGRAWVHAALAYDRDELVGYKLGRSDDPRCFESWRGGVKREYRRRGIASTLAQCQEDWCRSGPFQCIETRTSPDNAPMLILNLRRGFIISGTVLIRGEHMNVVLHKPVEGQSPAG